MHILKKRNKRRSKCEKNKQAEKHKQKQYGANLCKKGMKPSVFEDYISDKEGNTNSDNKRSNVNNHTFISACAREGVVYKNGGK